jgi:hypothetical protein
MATVTLKRPVRTVLAIAATAAMGAMLLMAGSAPASAAPAKAGVMAPTKACGLYPTDKRLTRAQVITRAQSWIAQRVQYDPNGCHANSYGNYRTEQFGFVSMAWGLADSRTAATIRAVTTQITHASLKPGDVLMRGTGTSAKIVLFLKWNDAGQTAATVFDTGHTTLVLQKVWTTAAMAGYAGLRYKNIQ